MPLHDGSEARQNVRPSRVPVSALLRARCPALRDWYSDSLNRLFLFLRENLVQQRQIVKTRKIRCLPSQKAGIKRRLRRGQQRVAQRVVRYLQAAESFV